MTPRAWLYLGVAIMLVALLTWYEEEKSEIRRVSENQTAESREVVVSAFRSYLKDQKNERSLVTLAKRIRLIDAELTRLTVERAYEINPNSRDIVILMSNYRPELKKRILELDPLYQENEQ